MSSSDFKVDLSQPGAEQMLQLLKKYNSSVVVEKHNPKKHIVRVIIKKTAQPQVSSKKNRYISLVLGKNHKDEKTGKARHSIVVTTK